MKLIVVGMLFVLTSFLFCAAALMAAPPLPNDVQIVQPDTSLPRELATFSGKWYGTYVQGGKTQESFVIVEKIDEGRANLYNYSPQYGWERYNADVIKERGKYKLWYRGRLGGYELSLKGEKLQLYSPPSSTVMFIRVD